MNYILTDTAVADDALLVYRGTAAAEGLHLLVPFLTDLDMLLGPLPSLRAAAALISRRCCSNGASFFTHRNHASVACLSDSRGVLQLSGPDVIHFLNVGSPLCCHNNDEHR
jgi:hypothetical protein